MPGMCPYSQSKRKTEKAMQSRGCGIRTPGGVYAETHLGQHGDPVESFLVDPPFPLDIQSLGITPRGVHLMQSEGDGPYHIFDWVGAAHYPNVADFVEEVRRLGVSRKLSPKLDFTKLTLRSRLILIHAKAFIGNWQEYQDHQGTTGVCCARAEAERANHAKGKGMCSRFWWQDVELVQKNDPVQGGEGLMGRMVSRQMPSFTYTAERRPDGVTPDYVPAVFASFPITQLAVVKDDKNNKHEERQQFARQSTFKVAVVDE